MQQKNVIIGILVGIAVIGAVIFYMNFTPLGSTPEPKVSVKDTPEKPTATALRPTPTEIIESSSPISPFSPPPVETTSDLDVETLQVMINQGIQAFQNKDYKTAIEVFTLVLEQNPTNSIAYNARGGAYDALGEYDKALNDFTKAIEYDPIFPHAYYNRGRVYTSLGKNSEALADLQKSVELSPDSFSYRANGNIGLLYHNMGDYDKALEAFAESISANKEEKADVYYYRAETHTALEDYVSAIADYQAAIERFSKYNLAYQSLAYVYYKTDQLDLAQQNLEQAISISPNSSITHFYLGLIYSTTEQFDEAETEIKQAINLLATLTEEQRPLILERVLTELETLAQESPDEIEPLIKLVPNP